MVIDAQFAYANSVANLSARIRSSAVSGSRLAAGPNTSRKNAVEIDCASRLSNPARNESTNAAPFRCRLSAGDSPHEFAAPEQQLQSSAIGTFANVWASAVANTS